MNGVLLVDKPQGMTSHDVVSQLRRALGIRQIGHAGTLDPDATGLLVMCIGTATKISAHLTAGNKMYQIGFLLGRETDTYDASGSVVAEKPVETTREEIEKIVTSFQGVQSQRPPLYSAVKVGGKKLYEYARKGESVEIPVREVMVHALRLVSYENPAGEMHVHCSKGTYVRSLVHDIGQVLQTGAITTAIRRIESSGLRLEDAKTLDEIVLSENPKELVQQSLLSIAEALVEVPKLKVPSAIRKRLSNGAGLRPADLEAAGWNPTERKLIDPLLVVGDSGEAIAIGVYDGVRSVRLRRVF